MSANVDSSVYSAAGLIRLIDNLIADYLKAR
jgi:hypothetical protein